MPGAGGREAPGGLRAGCRQGGPRCPSHGEGAPSINHLPAGVSLPVQVVEQDYKVFLVPTELSFPLLGKPSHPALRSLRSSCAPKAAGSSTGLGTPQDICFSLPVPGPAFPALSWSFSSCLPKTTDSSTGLGAPQDNRALFRMRR